MGKLYAKITLKDGAVTQISDEPIQIADEERGTFECIEVLEEPYGGLELGDILKDKHDRHFKDAPSPRITFKDGW